MRTIGIEGTKWSQSSGVGWTFIHTKQEEYSKLFQDSEHNARIPETGEIIVELVMPLFLILAWQRECEEERQVCIYYWWIFLCLHVYARHSHSRHAAESRWRFNFCKHLWERSTCHFMACPVGQEKAMEWDSLAQIPCRNSLKCVRADTLFIIDKVSLEFQKISSYQAFMWLHICLIMDMWLLI